MLRIPAPAKVNLYLHITGRRDDGYHEIDSLVAFADAGDDISIEHSDEFSFNVEGSFATGLENDENLVVRAARKFAGITGQNLNVSITLQKNLPVGAGLGGGSADAAAVLRGLAKLWQESVNADDFVSLGSDIPVCLRCRPVRMTGIGDQLKEKPQLPQTPVLLVHPGIPCATASVYKNYTPDFKTKTSLPETFDTPAGLADFLRMQSNCLTSAALSVVPEISNVLKEIENQNPLLARLSGSGSACFGLFDTDTACQNAAVQIKSAHPDWWVRAAILKKS